MANLNNELQLLLRALDNAGVSTQKFSRKIQEAGDNQEKLVSLVREMQQALNDAEGSAGNLYQTLRAITGELGSKNKALNSSISAYNKLTQLAGQLRDDEAGMIDLSKNQLKRLERKLSINKQLLKDEAQRLKNGDGLSAAGKEYLDFLEEAADAAGLDERSRAEYLKNGINRADEFNDKQKAILSSYYDQHKEVEELEKLTQERLRLEKIISKNMGVTGALVGGTGALMERLGMRSGIFHDAMEEATEEMRMQAKLLGENSTLLDRMGIAATGFSIVSRGFGQALFDPAAIIGGIVSAFLDVNKAQTEFIQLSGKSAKTLNGVQTEISSLTELLQTSAELTKQIGLDSTSVFSPDQIAQISDAKELLGISAEQGAQLGMVMKLTGESADQLGKSIYDNVDAGVSKKLVYDDILSTSDDIVASTGGNTEELTRSAAAARKLGMDLQKVNQIADGLMEFETSIGNELEAQLLTGKNINLSKARELALNNDLEGVAEELSKNGASAAEFAKMNRIQQESLAKALGMSREELGKMVLTEKAREGMTGEQIAAARGVTLEQSKQIDIQARIQKSVAKLAQAFAPVLEAVVPIVEALLSIVGPIAKGIGTIANYFSGWVKYLLVAVGAFKAMKTTMAGIQAIQLAINAAKGVEVTLNSGIVTSLGLQNTLAAVQLAREEGLVGMKAAELVLNETILGSIVAQGVAMVRNMPKHFRELGVLVAKAAAYAIANPINALAGAAVATGVGALIYSQVKADDMVSPGYGKRTLMGPEGAIALNNKDTVVAGTDLFSGGEQQGASTSIGGVDLSPLVTEIRQMKTEVSSVLKSILNKEGTVTLDGNKVGSALVLGSYKSS